MATLQGKAVKNTYRQVLQIGANNVGVSGTLQPVQDGAGVNTALSLSTGAATINGNLTITGDLIITGGGIEIKELIDDTVAALIKNGTGITWTYNDGANTLTGNFTGTTSVVAEGSNLYYTQGRFDSAFAAKSTTNLAEGTNLYFTEARGNANFATNFATKTTTNLPEGSNLYFTNARARTALSVTGGTGIAYDNATGVFNLAAIPNASLANSSITINGQSVSLGGTVTLTTTNIAEGTNLYWTEARGNANFATNLAASSTTNLAEGTNLYYTQARFDTAFSNKSTTNLAEGANLYYTQARFNSALAAKTTTDLAEGSNLYYTDTRARLALSSSATGLSYANNSGVFSLTAGYAIPTTAKLGQYDTAYNRSIVSAAVTGTGTKTLSITQQDANVVSATWTDLGITTINGTVNQIAATTVANTTTLAFTNDVTMPNNLVVSGNLTINGTATYVNTQSISAKDPLFEVANDNNTTDVVDIGYYGRYYDTPQTRVEFTGLFRDASDAGKFKFFTGLVDEPTNVVNTTGTGYTVGTLVANFEGNLAGTANAANALTTARTIAASGDAVWSVSFDGSANVTSALTLANTGVTATTYGTSTAVPTIAIDGKGRITSASNTNIAFPVTTVNGAAGTVVLTTTNIAEGTNQYFTTGRAQSAITLSTTGTSGAATYTSGNINVPIYIGGSGTINEIAAFDTTGTINSLSTATYPSLTELSYVKGVTSAIQTQLNSKLNLSGGTLTGGLSGTTGTFSGILTTPQVKASTSAGLSINANSGTQVADFGAGGSANITFFGGLSGTSATFSSTLGVTGALSGTTATFSGEISTTSGLISISGNGVSGPPSGGVGIRHTANRLLIYGGTTDFTVQKNANTGPNLTILESGAATFYGSITGTSATFSELITSNVTTSTNAIFNSTNANGGFIAFRRSGTNIGYLGNSAQLGIGTLNALELRADNNLYLTTTSGLLSITSGGNVGIGTSSPTNPLHIVSNTVSQLNVSALSGNTNAQINLEPTGTGIALIGPASNFQLSFRTNNIERIKIANTGEVIIRGAFEAGNAGGAVSRGDLSVDPTSTAAKVIIGRISSTGSDNTELVGTNRAGVQGWSINAFGLATFTSLGTGLVYSNAGALTSTNPSDERLKDKIKDISWGLSDILKLRPVSYQWKDDKINQGIQFGFIAQEVQDVMPEAIKEFGDEIKYLGLEKDAIYATLVKAIQELESRIKDLEAK